MSRDRDRRVLVVLSRMCDREMLRRVIEPIVADFRLECEEATRLNRIWWRRWLHVVYVGALLRAVLLYIPDRWFDRAPSTKRPNHGFAPMAMIITTTAATTVALALFLVPPLWQFSPLEWKSVVYLLPQSLPFALPIGLTFTVFLRGRAITASTRIQTLGVAIFFSAISFVLLGWSLPTANQVLRQLAFQAPSNSARSVGTSASFVTGSNELTMTELVEQSRKLPLNNPAGRLARLLYYEKWALPFMALILVIFAFAVVNKWRIGSVGAITFALGSFATYGMLMKFGRISALDGAWGPAAGAWLPNAFFVSVTALLWLLHRPRQRIV